MEKTKEEYEADIEGLERLCRMARVPEILIEWRGRMAELTEGDREWAMNEMTKLEKRTEVQDGQE